METFNIFQATGGDLSGHAVASLVLLGFGLAVLGLSHLASPRE